MNNNEVPTNHHDYITDETQLKHRLDSLQQENVVLKSEIEALRLKIRSLQEENLQLRKNSVNIQVRAEQEEEYISNKLLKKITELKKEKESLALNYEQEEEFLTNDLTRKLSQLRAEKATLEKTLEKEQEAQINKLMSRIQKLENDVMLKQKSLDTLRREKIELENALEQEQEGLVNRLWKKMEKLESEKRILQSKLDLSPSPMLSAAFVDIPRSNDNLDSRNRAASTNPNNDSEMDVLDWRVISHSVSLPVHNNQCSEQEIDTVLSSMDVESDRASLIHSYIGRLRQEVVRLRDAVDNTNNQCTDKLRNLERDEKILQDENRLLRKRLQAEIERRQEMCRNLSESESSLEIDEERQFNETCRRRVNVVDLSSKNRIRTISDSSSISNYGNRSQHHSVDYSNTKIIPTLKDDKQVVNNNESLYRKSTSSNTSQLSLRNNLSLEVPMSYAIYSQDCNESNSRLDDVNNDDQLMASIESDAE